MNSTPKLPLCKTEIHLRISTELKENLQRVANSYNLKNSTFARMILMRELHNYDKNRFFT